MNLIILMNWLQEKNLRNMIKFKIEYYAQKCIKKQGRISPTLSSLSC